MRSRITKLRERDPIGWCAIGSPHLLLLSGVGPQDALDAVSIPVHHELPGVGQNLRDHPHVRVTWWTRDDFEQPLGLPGVQFTLRYTAEGSDLVNDMLIHPGSRSINWSQVVGARRER